MIGAELTISRRLVARIRQERKAEPLHAGQGAAAGILLAPRSRLTEDESGDLGIGDQEGRGVVRTTAP